MIFDKLEELNDWLMKEASNIDEVKNYDRYEYIDYYDDGRVCNQWSEYGVLVKMLNGGDYDV